ncbi:hypothetical protein HAX54_051982, partial [Datura stramonium]|nr:hypothetical protein [Datura stramonium]
MCAHCLTLRHSGGITVWDCFNIISIFDLTKVCSGGEDIYHFQAYNVKAHKYISLDNEYKGKVLLIVNIPQQGSKWTNSEIRYLNELRRRYKGKSSVYNDGFLHDKAELGENLEYGGGEREILDNADFPIFGKVEVNDDHESHFRKYIFPNTIRREKDEDLWYFLRNIPIDGQKIGKINQEFEKILVSGIGVPVRHYPRFDGETLQSQPVQPGGDPGRTAGSRADPRLSIQ